MTSKRLECQYITHLPANAKSLDKRKSLCYRSTMNVSFNRGRPTRVRINAVSFTYLSDNKI